MNLLKKLIRTTNDPSRDFQERLFLMITSIAETVLILVFIADILLNEDIWEIIVLGYSIISSPILVYVSIRRHITVLTSKIMALTIVFIVLPVTFFYGGGMFGGSVIWFSFSYLYIGLLLTGAWRITMLILLTILAGVEYYCAYNFHEAITAHTVSMFYLDSFISVVLVGLVIFVTVWFQNKLFMLENKRAKEEAKKVEELSLAQNRFFSNMSHEIRTPINTIIGLNEMILREDISEEAAQDAANVRAASKMLLHLINDILDMSKLGSGEMQLTPVAYKPGDMLSELVGMLWIRAREKGLEFSINVAPDIPGELIGDEVRIKQILINVVNNAIKYTKEGSVSLSVQCGERHGSQLSVIYTVTDTGIGIKKENIPYLFTAFKRIDETNNRHIEGTGLGLSIVKQLVDLMDGKVTVNSIYTKGTTFIVEIPQTVSDENSIGEIDLKKNHQQKIKTAYKQKFEAPDARVLIVDDNASNLLVATKLLRDTKVQTDTASSGEQALAKTLTSKYHVILMDHLMPEMDGIECLKNIRTQVGGMCRDSKIVALTANVGSDSRLLYEREGFDGYLSKPISGSELETEVCRLLPSDIVYMSGSDEEILEETISWMRSDQKKRNIAVTTESVADLPQELAEKYGIAVLPHLVRTDEGVFRDGKEIDTGGLLNYMKDRTHKVSAVPPGVREHEEFFAKQLSSANNIIHISISGRVNGSGCKNAAEAARAFDNVTVVDTGHLSSGQGLIAIEASRLAAQGKTVEEITAYIKSFKQRVNTSFIVDNLDFLARAKQVSDSIANLTRSFMAKPVVRLRNGRMSIGKVLFGTRENAWKKYIDRTLAHPDSINNDTLFITYVGLTNRDLEKIRKMILSRMTFKNVYFQKASPGIAVNSGPGTFGLLFSYK